ncbi:unnamed protein product, partial [Musa textilis]
YPPVSPSLWFLRWCFVLQRPIGAGNRRWPCVKRARRRRARCFEAEAKEVPPRMPKSNLRHDGGQK